MTGAPVSAPVAQVINLDFPIFPGTNYKLCPRGYTGIDGLLYESNTTAGYFGYPLNVQNLVDIKYSTLTAAPTNTPNTGLYYYFYDWKVGNKCESARSPVTVTVDSTLSTSEADTKNTVKIYPNPFSDAITIDRPELIGSLGIFDASGKLVMRNVKAEQKLILSHLVPGAYIVQILMKDGTRQSVKLIKK
uniref:T9SS type A sorting domain-containing protein n=1 Tax=Chryseobacterium endophyticum TaxID=1854762 RepID=A0AAU6WPF4_9FLAO